MVEVQMDRFGTIINVRDPEELLHPRHGQDVYVDEVQTTRSPESLCWSVEWAL
jgi:hypothetical protein